MNIDHAVKALEAAQGDPEKLALATLEIFLADREPQLRVALEAAAVPHWFNTPILAALLDLSTEAATTTLAALRALPMVETFARRGFNVHERSRLAIRGRLAQEDGERLQVLSRRAAQCFAGDEPAWQIERVYHRLCAAPQDAPEELRRLWEGWNRRGRSEWLQALGVALQELVRVNYLPPASRARALLCLGWIRASRTYLREREPIAREASHLFDELQHDPGRADAHDLLGDVLQAQGKLADALREYQAGNAIVQRLVSRGAENTDWQRDLAVSHNKLGRVLQVHGKLPDALREYQADKAIMKRLVAYGFDNTDWQRDLAVSHNCVGSALQEQGKLAGALREYEAGKVIMQRLVERDPDNTDWQRDVAISHRNLGSVLKEQGKLPEALREYQAGKTIIERLVAHDPDNTDWQRDLSVAHNEVGRVLQASGKTREALRACQAGKAIMERLAARDPDNADWQRTLSVLHSSVGSVLRALGRRAEAQAELYADLAIVERLAALEPSNAEWQEDLEASRRALDELRQRRG